MNIILAPDKFKDCMTSPQVCSILSDAFLRRIPGCNMVSLPLADGGEGTSDAVWNALGGKTFSVPVSGPDGIQVQASFILTPDGKTAVLDMASASGLQLLSPAARNPLHTSTFGTGELIRAAMDAGAARIVVGLGGSATCDGGAGMAQALGFRLLDAQGMDIGRGSAELARLVRVDSSAADPRLDSVQIISACDVTCPLTGPSGSVSMFAPQKGADAPMLPLLEHNLIHFASVLIAHRLAGSSDLPGDGAAGGLGFGLRAFCRASYRSGAEMLLELSRFQDHLRHADLVITGEGASDAQTFSGKLCSAVARAARAAGVPVLLLSGAVTGDPERFLKEFDMVFSIARGPCTLDGAVADGPLNLRFAADNIARLIATFGVVV